MRIQPILKVAAVLIVLGLLGPAKASAQCHSYYPSCGPRYYPACGSYYYPVYRPCYGPRYYHGHYYRRRCW